MTFYFHFSFSTVIKTLFIPIISSFCLGCWSPISQSSSELRAFDSWKNAVDCEEEGRAQLSGITKNNGKHLNSLCSFPCGTGEWEDFWNLDMIKRNERRRRSGGIHSPSTRWPCIVWCCLRILPMPKCSNAIKLFTHIFQNSLLLFSSSFFPGWLCRRCQLPFAFHIANALFWCVQLRFCFFMMSRLATVQ